MKKPLTYVGAIAFLNEINKSMYDSTQISKQEFCKNCDFLQKLIYQSVVFEEKKPGLIETVEKLTQKHNLTPIAFQNSFISLQTNLN
ncbi:hypothetical protein [Epilithonimonas hungarica]|uniref:Uncharacterized protein n=1 Tax=Epilithonimonas hungarica TaxID=454006 RepID=A0A1G7F9E8_9FLAO|nr:hypothetical protein [Epilithonimonas hungarica]SDE72145.1 hypothetical protein SAMN05421825_0012 [Epilithonimonas hungarica]